MLKKSFKKTLDDFFVYKLADTYFVNYFDFNKYYI